MRFVKRTVASFLLLCFTTDPLNLAVAYAQATVGQSKQETTIPDTPAGRQLADFLVAINTGDVNIIRTFIAEHFDKLLLISGQGFLMSAYSEDGSQIITAGYRSQGPNFPNTFSVTRVGTGLSYVKGFQPLNTSGGPGQLAFFNFSSRTPTPPPGSRTGHRSLTGPGINRNCNGVLTPQA